MDKILATQEVSTMESRTTAAMSVLKAGIPVQYDEQKSAMENMAKLVASKATNDLESEKLASFVCQQHKAIAHPETVHPWFEKSLSNEFVTSHVVHGIKGGFQKLSITRCPGSVLVTVRNQGRKPCNFYPAPRGFEKGYRS